MTPYLLDVNVVLSLISASHEFHTKTAEWFMQTGSHRWCTSPIIQNGAIRIALNASAMGSHLTAAQVLSVISKLTSIGDHQFVPDDLSILDYSEIFSVILSRNQVTDAYLLLLAIRHGATFATHDRRLLPLADRIPNARVHLIR